MQFYMVLLIYFLHSHVPVKEKRKTERHNILLLLFYKLNIDILLQDIEQKRPLCVRFFEHVQISLTC